MRRLHVARATRRTRQTALFLSHGGAHIKRRLLPLPEGSDTSLRRLLRRAWEISPEDQIAMQAVVQQRVDGAVSKTVLLDPRSRPTPADVVAWIRLAHRLGCKGVAFFHPDASSVASASIDHCAARGAACPD